MFLGLKHYTFPFNHRQENQFMKCYHYIILILFFIVIIFFLFKNLFIIIFRYERINCFVYKRGETFREGERPARQKVAGNRLALPLLAVALFECLAVRGSLVIVLSLLLSRPRILSLPLMNHLCRGLSTLLSLADTFAVTFQQDTTTRSARM